MKRLTKRQLWLLIVILAAFLRIWAALMLPVDADEPVYLEAGHDYAQLMRQGDLQGVIDYPGVREHPALVKLLYGFAWLGVGDSDNFYLALVISRCISVVFGTLAVGLLAWFDPLAGGLLAVHMMAVKYTSEVYLEAMPLCMSFAAVFAAYYADKGSKRWLWLSAVALGATGAGKFTYFPVIFPVLYLLIWEQKRSWSDLARYLVIAALAFLALNPTLWNEPFTRLFDSVFFHMRYSQSTHVRQSGLPWYQPFIWLTQTHPQQWHARVFFYFGLDGLVGILGLAGLFWEWQERRWNVIWILTGLATLLLWPTKWPQYTLIITVPLCLSAATSARLLYKWIGAREEFWAWVSNFFMEPPKAAIYSLVIFVGLITTGYVVTNLQLSFERFKWLHLTPLNTPLPSFTVYDIEITGSSIVLGTHQGAVIWEQAEGTGEDIWSIFTTENSDLPHNRVLAILKAADDTLWFGTEAGLAHYDDNVWQVFQASEIGLSGNKFQAIAQGQDGTIWIGSNGGVAAFDGDHWSTYTAAKSGLIDDFIFSVIVGPAPGGDIVWAGSREALCYFETAKATAAGQWVCTDNAEIGFGQGVATLTLDSQGKVWAGTFGGGLWRYDGRAWEAFRTSNSELPYNTISAVIETEPGSYWIGTARPSQEGGFITVFDGETWQTYTPKNSGFSGSEPLAFATDDQGQVWIGSRTAGLEIYRADD